MNSCKSKDEPEKFNTDSFIGVWESYNFQQTGDGGYNRATGEYSFAFDGKRAKLCIARENGGEGADTYIVNCPISGDETKVSINFETNFGEQARVVAQLRDGELVVQEVHQTWDWHYVYYCTKVSNSANIKGISVEKIELKETTIDIRTGSESAIIVSKILPDNATDKELIYSSSNENVVRVEQDGSFKAISEGTAKITVASSDKNASATCEIVVSDNGPIPTYGRYNGLDWVQLWSNGPKWAALPYGAKEQGKVGSLFTYSELETSIPELNNGWRLPRETDFEGFKSNCVRQWDYSCGVTYSSRSNANIIVLPITNKRENTAEYWESGMFYGSVLYCSMGSEGDTYVQATSQYGSRGVILILNEE